MADRHLRSCLRERFRAGRTLTALAMAGVVISTACVPPAIANRTDPACAWQVAAIGTDVSPDLASNVVFPDTAANYWITRIPMSTGTRVTVAGPAIDARYWSLQTYRSTDLFGSTIGSLRDDEVTAAPDGSFEIVVTPRGGTGRPNEIPGHAVGRDADATWLMFRTYLSADPERPAGAATLPTVTVTDSWGSRVLPTCPRPTNPPGDDSAGVEVQGSIPEILNDGTPQWRRTAPAVTPFPNEDSRYLAASVAHTSGQVVAIRGLAPSHPGDAVGTPVGKAAMRYWSVCKFGLPSTRTVSCVADEQLTLDDQGRYGVVVADPRDVPAVAPADDHVAWLPWGAEVFGAVALRNLAPHPSFAFSIFEVPIGGGPVPHMGPFAPDIATCATSVIESDGFDACFEPAP